MIAVRAEQPSDRTAIHGLIAQAFGSDAEAGLVDTLRDQGDLIVSLVAERDGNLAGHIAFSPMSIEADGHNVPGAGLAPLAVSTDARRQGVAALLVREGLAHLRETGMKLAFVLGDPHYYGRFGFSAEAAAPFASPYAGPYFMALRLDPAFVLPQTGRADYAPAFAALG